MPDTTYQLNTCSYNKSELDFPFIKNFFVIKSEGIILKPTIDEQLVAGCIKGDRNAQKALFQKYSREMHRVASLIVNSDDLANDVIQESFIKVFENIRKLRNPGSLKWWIKTTVVRTAYAMKKEEFVFTYSENGSNDIIEWPDDMSGEYLYKAIGLLPFGYRAVFIMIEVEGFSHKETAGMLNISVGTSKSQLYHAKKKLIEIIDQLLIK